MSANTRPKPTTVSTGKRSKVIDQESVGGCRKIKEDFHILHRRPSLNRDLGYLITEPDLFANKDPTMWFNTQQRNEM